MKKAQKPTIVKPNKAKIKKPAMATVPKVKNR